MKQRLVVIGNGMDGMRTVEELLLMIANGIHLHTGKNKAEYE